MGRDAKDWVSRLEPGAKGWSNPDAVGCDIRYCCHDPIFLKNRKGEIILLFAKFLDTEVNFTTWCNGRDELWMRKTQDNGRTWLPAVPAGIQSGHASNDSVLLPDGTIVFASTSTELPEYYFGAVQIYRSHDDGESWEKGALLTADDGNRIRRARDLPAPGTDGCCCSPVPAPHCRMGHGGQPFAAVLPRGKPRRRPDLEPAEALRHSEQRIQAGRHQLGQRNHPDGL